MCKKVGVQWVEGEKLLHPKRATDNKTFDVYKNYADYTGSSARASEVGPSTLTKPRTPTQRMNGLEEQM